MSRFSKALLVVGGVVVALAIVVYVNRVELMLSAIEVMADRQTPVSPNRPVVWDSGRDPAGAPASERPPNVVLILADDLGWNDITLGGGGVAGGTVPTPHIDSIAKEGVAFTQGYAANGTCAPSRAAIMSGRYGTRFGFEFTPTPDAMMPALRTIISAAGGARSQVRPPMVVDEEAEAIPYEQMGMPPSEITLAELLKERGYHTAHIGKWHLGREGGMSPHEQGFDESLLMASGLYLKKDDPGVVNAKQDFDPIDLFLWRALKFAASFNGGDAFEPARYLTDYYTDEAVKAIEANRDRPFFLYLAHWAPHTPLQAAKEDYDALSHIELHRERVYAAMIRSLDRGVGRVLDALRTHGLEENTLVLFTSDNGGAAYIGLPHVNDPFRGWKITLFEGGVHVPFLAKWPAKIAPGRTYEAPVHHFDLYATAAAAAGAPLPSDRKMDGVDLVPYVRGETAGVPHEMLFWRSGAAQSVRRGRWKLNVSDPPGRDDRREWLFDLESDPGERRDLSAEQPAVLAALRAALDTHNAEQAEPRWPSQMSTPINLDRAEHEPDQPGDEFAYWSN
ncbi:MAG: sulfatase [Deltaproteobacteria bacterium]|nr:sulfatase [Deltaproteobacteria bacterium]